MKTTIKIVAKGQNVEQTIEMLGDAYGRTYATREEAAAAAAELQSDAKINGLTGVTYVVVETTVG